MPYHALTLTRAAAATLAQGRRDLALDIVPEAERCEAGQPVRLMSPEGEVVALALVDRDNALVRVLGLEGEGYMAPDLRLFRDRVQRAISLRRALGLAREHTPHRLIHGAGDGLPGWALDVYGDYAVLYAYSRALFVLGRALAGVVLEELGVRGVVLKLRAREASAGAPKQEIIGEEPPERVIIEEAGLSFEVHLGAALNVGFFSDMREHRARLRQLAPERSVLNLFSYTGSLSVAAARAGARSVTSVDLSAGVQRWARANFELNRLPLEPHRFETGEVTAFLKKAARAGETFELIIVDPPTHSAARAGAWSMRKDYPDLIVRTCELLPRGGLLWLSANSRELPSLPDLARGAFERAKRSAQLLNVGGLPPDYPTLPAQPEDRYLQVSLFCVW